MTDQDWHLTGPGIVKKIRDIAKSFYIDVLDVSSTSSNLPTTFNISTDAGVMTLRVYSTDADGAEEEINNAFKRCDDFISDHTRPDNLPKDNDSQSVTRRKKL